MTLFELFLPKHRMCFLSVLQNLLFLSSRVKLAVPNLSGNALFSNWNTVILTSIPLNFMGCCILPVFPHLFSNSLYHFLRQKQLLTFVQQYQTSVFLCPFWHRNESMHRCTVNLFWQCFIFSLFILLRVWVFSHVFGVLWLTGWVFLGFFVHLVLAFQTKKNYCINLDPAADVFLSLSPKKLHCYYSKFKGHLVADAASLLLNNLLNHYP